MKNLLIWKNIANKFSSFRLTWRIKSFNPLAYSWTGSIPLETISFQNLWRKNELDYEFWKNMKMSIEVK